MPRARALDFYQNHRFHVFDLSTGDFSVLNTSAALPFTVLSPQIGFASCTAPEMSIEMEAIKPGNSPFPVEVVKSASCSPITLTRGVFSGDNEFYRWIRRAVYGQTRYRRDLAIIQFHSFGMASNSPVEIESVFAHAEAAIGAATEALKINGGLVNLAASATEQAARDAFQGRSGAVFAGRLFVLRDCLPSRYKAGQDFDATSADITVSELEIMYEYFLEYSFGPPRELGYFRN